MEIVKPQAISNDQITVNVSETEASEYAASVTYGLGAEVIRDHKIYVSTIAGNVGNDPLLQDQTLTSVLWLFKAFTNAFAFRDGVLSHKTEKSGTLEINFYDLDNFDAVVLFGLVGSQVIVRGYAADGSQLLWKKIILSGRIVAGWRDWLTKGFNSYSNKVVVKDMPAGVSRLRITLSGSQTAIGEVVLGDLVDVGKTQVSGTSGQSIPMSTVDWNQYGTLTLVKRPTRTEMTYRVFVSTDKFEAIKPVLDDLQGEIVAVIGSEARASTVNLGVLGAIKWSEGMHDGVFFQVTLRGVI